MMSLNVIIRIIPFFLLGIIVLNFSMLTAWADFKHSEWPFSKNVSLPKAFDGMSYVFSIIPTLNKSFRQTDTVAGDLWTRSLISGNVRICFRSNNVMICFTVGRVSCLQMSASFLGIDLS